MLCGFTHVLRFNLTLHPDLVNLYMVIFLDTAGLYPGFLVPLIVCYNITFRKKKITQEPAVFFSWLHARTSMINRHLVTDLVVQLAPFITV